MSEFARWREWDGQPRRATSGRAGSAEAERGPGVQGGVDVVRYRKNGLMHVHFPLPVFGFGAGKMEAAPEKHLAKLSVNALIGLRARAWTWST